MERHVVLAHELHVAHVRRALVFTPPAAPVGLAQSVGVGPFGGGGDVFDGRVEPDVEDLALHAGPVCVALLHRDAPVEVAGDAAILKAVAIVEPFLRDRGGQHRPVASASQSSRADDRAGRTGADRDAWSRAPRDRSIPRWPSAAPAGRSGRAAWCSSRTGRRGRARSRNWGRCPRYSGRAEAAVGVGVDLLFRSPPRSAPPRQPPGEMLGQRVVARRRTSARNDRSRAETRRRASFGRSNISAQ